MSEKSIHVVFQVINHLCHLCHTSNPDKLLLIILASFSGVRGICPSASKIAKRMCISKRQLYRAFQRLEDQKLIKVTRSIGKANQFELLFLSTTSDMYVTSTQKQPVTPVSPVPVTCMSPTSDMGVTLYNKRNNKENNRESALLNFKADENNIFLAKDLRLDLIAEVESFKNRHKGKVSQYEFSRWMKASKEYKQSKGGTQEVKSTVPEWAPGYAAYDEWFKNFGSNSNGMQIPRTNGRGTGSN